MDQLVLMKIQMGKQMKYRKNKCYLASERPRTEDWDLLTEGRIIKQITDHLTIVNM